MRGDLLASTTRGLRAALYARYSTGNQSPLSVEDQLRLCRELAARIGAHVVREFSDAEMSGFDNTRPQYHQLLDFARAGRCDIVIAEHSNRMARDGEAGWRVFNLFKRLGVAYRTVQEGEMTVIGQAVSTLMSESKGDEVSQFTRRGLRGRVEAGRSAGGLAYGYRKQRVYDAAGEPVRGLLEIDEAQAQVVRRIYRQYAAGSSARTIAQILNAEGVPAPRGGPWGYGVILGNAKRGDGILNNELYRGVRVWGRRTFTKDRETGSRSGRPNGDDQVTRVDAPELRIIDDDLWADVRAQHERLSAIAKAKGAGATKRPKRFLQGLLVCGLCGGKLHRSGPRLAMACSTRLTGKSFCTNSTRPGYAGIEARAFANIKANLLRPDAIEIAIGEMQAQLEAERKDEARRQAKASAELAEVKRRLARLIDQMEHGAPWSAIAERHAELEARRQTLEDSSAGAVEQSAADVIRMSKSVAQAYARYVEDLAAALDNPEGLEDRDAGRAIRALIDKVTVTPTEGHGQYDLVLEGDLAPLLMLGNPDNKKGLLSEALVVSHVKGRVGAGTGFEPVTFRL